MSKPRTIVNIEKSKSPAAAYYERDIVMEDVLRAIDLTKSPEELSSAEAYEKLVAACMAAVPRPRKSALTEGWEEEAFGYGELAALDQSIREAQQGCRDRNLPRWNGYNCMLNALNVVRDNLWPDQPKLTGADLSTGDHQKMERIKLQHAESIKAGRRF